MPLVKLPRLAVNWYQQPEMTRRYWDIVTTYLENIGSFTGIISGGNGINFDTGTGVISLDDADTQNTDHASVTLSADGGLVGGGDITMSRSFAVGAGAGILVNPNDVSVSAKLQLYDGGDTPSAFTLSIVDSADALAWRTAIGAGVGTVTSVNVSGGTTGLTFSGGPVTSSGTITVAGTLAVANGGTGVTTSTGTGNVVLSASPTFTGTAVFAGVDINGGISAVTGGNAVTISPSTAALALGTGQTSGSISLGGSSTGTGTINLGRSTVTQTLNLSGGATASGSTKTVTIGTGGVAGSTTNITIGATAGTVSTTMNGSVLFAGLPRANTTIGVGNTVPSASGAGISFPATESPSTDPNTLDDYEEGSWTPTVTASTGTLTSYTASGNYVKIGRQVTAYVDISITDNGTGATRIDFTLPFTAAGGIYTGAGRENNATGKMLQVAVGYTAATTAAIHNYDNTYPGGTGYRLLAAVTYIV